MYVEGREVVPVLVKGLVVVLDELLCEACQIGRVEGRVWGDGLAMLSKSESWLARLI